MNRGTQQQDNTMKKVKLFEQFINEARVNAQDFADMFSETMANIEEQYDFEEELSTENLLYMLSIAWSEVAEQNNFNEKMGDLGVAFDRFNIDRSSKFMRADLTKEARYFGANAYGETGYHLQGMVECFCYILSDYGLVKPAIVKKIEKFLLNTSESIIGEARSLIINESATAPDKITADGRNWRIGTANHHHFGEILAFQFMASDKMFWHLDMKKAAEEQDRLLLVNMGDVQGEAYLSNERYDVKRLAKKMMKIAEEAQDRDSMNYGLRPGEYQGKKITLRDYVKALEAWVELRDSIGIANESMVNESAIDTLADEIDDAKVYDASSDGDSVDARSTKKTWDDGVPVLKYIARAPKKSVKLPKKFKVVDDTKYGWWYFQVGNTWYGIEQDDYGTPPFEY